MKIKIKVQLADIKYPLQITEKGDWVDLRTINDVYLKGPESKMLKRDRKKGQPEGEGKRKVKFYPSLIDLGIAMELPKGFEAWVLPRSSTPSKWSIVLANSKGIIDNSYHGPSDTWKFGALAFDDSFIPAGTRIAQFRVALSQKATVWQKLKWLFSSGIEFEYVNSLNNDNRGGIGSTGTK